MSMDRKLMSVLACPRCGGSVKSSSMFVICEKCKLAYPVLGSVPDMLLEDAWKLDKARRSKFTHDIRVS